MGTALITHIDCYDHVTPPGHPERVERLTAVLSSLETPEFQDLIRVEAPLADDVALRRAHSEAHMRAVAAAIPEDGVTPIDSDTWAAPGSDRAARRAAGAVISGVDMILGREAGNAFCAVRPPGHHAERDRAMGFCLYSSAAVGALHAIEAHGLSRVAILDFDVHHGNGTQNIAEADGRLFYASCHEWPLFPGTGLESDVGAGNLSNIRLPALSGSIEFREAVSTGLIAPAERFQPELVIISAGFDAHGDDPLAQLLVHEDDFAWATDQICRMAQRVCGGRVVSTLEGGYDLGALGRSAAAHVRALMTHGAAAL